VLAPFTSLVFITPILLASDGLFPQAATPGRVVTDVFIALTVLLAGWFVGQWFVEPLDLDRYHPGYFLPTVAGSLVASQAAALVGGIAIRTVIAISRHQLLPPNGPWTPPVSHTISPRRLAASRTAEPLELT
jgi:hypothetical protein